MGQPDLAPLYGRLHYGRYHHRLGRRLGRLQDQDARKLLTLQRIRSRRTEDLESTTNQICRRLHDGVPTVLHDYRLGRQRFDAYVPTRSQANRTQRTHEKWIQPQYTRRAHGRSHSDRQRTLRARIGRTPIQSGNTRNRDYERSTSTNLSTFAPQPRTSAKLYAPCPRCIRNQWL